ncbi:putative secreted glycosyl hydrolase [Actinacidiphila reveromycinica]|uniref:Putative secreted glycosyl hydrolase n=1 Tax=Actinacidiphila reveromycinica TaxID=659352 RepID=A0A7U3UW95_9ACTN|nr:cellulose binding domain-containing protein [Streptomyces sp. SN-593]BBB01401.1 putative secreted glycosyl hydrolase [Streptomyces sp. SN-593]
MRRGHPRNRALRTAAGLAAGGLVAVGATWAVQQQAGAASAGCTVDYSVTSTWTGGFGASVKVTNLGNAVSSWTLRWSFAAGETVTQAWNADVTLNSTQVTAGSLSYNGAVPTGGSVDFGFNGSVPGSGSPTVPPSFTFNGTVCTGGVSTSGGSDSGAAAGGDTGGNTGGTGTPPAGQGRQVEKLDRGVVSVRSGSGNLVSWRWLATDPDDIAFNVYRGTTKVNSSPLTGATDFTDAGAPADAVYTVRAVVDGVEQTASPPSVSFANGYHDVPIRPPAGGTTPDGVSYTYEANDASVGDLDGDGSYEFVLKWNPTNAKDNSQAGYTGDTYIDAYRIDGTRLWRIDLGRNIRSGAHYTQFQVYDYDGDGKAEVAMKTADGTTDGVGKVIGNASADYRNSSGYILSGPEYLTVFNGQTGAAMQTVNYDPPRGTVSSWGDTYGNRVDRFLAGTAYLDGSRPSIIMARGYYTRTVIAAWDWRDGKLTERWRFDTNDSGNSSYAGQGDHQLAVADVDKDGKDEIVYGAMAVDDNGHALWNTGEGHGDAMHVGDLDPSRPGLEEFKVDEDTGKLSAWFADARTGQILWHQPDCACDNGRGVSDDVYAGSPGAESWSAGVSGPYNTLGQNIGRKPGSANFVVWWDGDPVRELLDDTHIDKYGTSADSRLLTASGVHSNNTTKATPSLSADLFGDWREEVVWPTTDNRALRIYATPDPTTLRITTLMHDTQYREAVAWQNTAYNQPPHPGFFIGNGMPTPPRPTVHTP